MTNVYRMRRQMSLGCGRVGDGSDGGVASAKVVVVEETKGELEVVAEATLEEAAEGDLVED